MKQNFHFWLKSAIALCSLAAYSPVQAQVVPDATLPSNSSVTSEGNASTITGGTQAGNNLFHSFKEFSIPTGGTAYFNNPANIQNIISRVTGKSISNIDGLLQANGTANLFLINPNGIIFGSNAKLNIGGSFVASTASSLKFADGNFFSATTPETTPLLTVSVPLGLQFGENAAAIRVQGNGQSQRTTTDSIDINALSGNTAAAVPVQPNQTPANTTAGLQVLPDQTLAIVGGDVSLAGGTLKTAGGRIELGSVTGSSFVSLTPTNKGWALSYENLPTYGDIKLSGGATVDASGNGGGDIQVRGKRIEITNGSQIETTTLGAGTGGTLTVNASELLEVSGTSADGKYFSGLLARVDPAITGSGSNINIETSNLSVQNGGVIAASTRSGGQGGYLKIKADSVHISGTSANSIPAGLFTTTEKEATGVGGNLIIETDNLTVRDGAVVAAGTTSKGRSGNIDVKADNSVQVSGFSGRIRSRLTAGSAGVGDAGDLSIETGQLTVQDNASVSVASLFSGKAGELRVTAGSAKLDNKGTITARTVSGNGGNIKLKLEDLLLLSPYSEISTNAGKSGNGGNITIDTNLLIATENSNISANAGRQGGNVRITSKGLLSSLDSKITATSEQGPQFDGVVEINTLDIDPSSGLVNLPVDLVDVSGLIAQGCLAGEGRNASKFVVTGRGGLPPSPKEALCL